MWTFDNKMATVSSVYCPKLDVIHSWVTTTWQSDGQSSFLDREKYIRKERKIVQDSMENIKGQFPFKRQILSLIRYFLLLKTGLPFVFRTALVISGRGSVKSSQILVHTHMIASHSCCIFVGGAKFLIHQYLLDWGVVTGGHCYLIVMLKRPVWDDL